MTSNPVPFLRNQLVAVRCDNGNFWSVVGMGGIPGQGATCFHSDVKQANSWEKFRIEVVDAAAFKFAVKTTTGYYITAEGGGGKGGPNDGTSPVHTDSTAVNAWEKLIFEYQSDGTFAIKTLTGYYLTCIDNGNHRYETQPFSSSITARNSWETFSVIPLQIFRSVRFAMRTPRNYYVSAVNKGGLSNPDLALCTGRQTVGNYEKFYVDIVDLGQNQFALRTLSGYYITFINGGGIGGNRDATCPVQTLMSGLGDWEQFVAEAQVDGTYAFKTVGGYYLTAVNGGGKQPVGNPPITSTATTIGANEIFTAVYY